LGALCDLVAKAKEALAVTTIVHDKKKVVGMAPNVRMMHEDTMGFE
jgi:hypothetical protein